MVCKHERALQHLHPLYPDCDGTSMTIIFVFGNLFQSFRFVSESRSLAWPLSLKAQSSVVATSWDLGRSLFEIMLELRMISYIRIDPQEKLTEIQQEISALHKLYSSQPVFGVEYTTQVLAAHGVSCKYLQILQRTSHPRRRR